MPKSAKAEDRAKLLEDHISGMELLQKTIAELRQSNPGMEPRLEVYNSRHVRVVIAAPGSMLDDGSRTDEGRIRDVNGETI
jgi:hypothetical protein